MTDMTPRQKKDLAATWAAALKRLRDRAGLKQIQAAEKLGIEQGTYSRYESGSTAILDLNLQRRLSTAFGFGPDELANEHAGMTFETERTPTDTLYRPTLIYPLVGRAKAGPKGAVFDEEDLGEYDFGRILDRHTRLVRVTGESMLPILEPGSIVAMDTNGYPKKNALAVIIMEDGSYYVKKFCRFTDTHVECIEMEPLDVDGRTFYGEKIVTFEAVAVRAVYPATLRID